MGNMHLVTGYQGQDHVTAADHGSLYAAIFGNGSYVLDRGNKLAASVISSNKVRISDGDIVLQGRHIRLNEGAGIELTIENGTQGHKRNDLIVARYTRNASTGVEEANLVVIKGTASTSTPADPAYNNGDILADHAEVVDFPLYRVPLDGITIGTLEQLFTVAYLVTLGSNKKIPSDYLPSMDYIPTSQKGKANGVAALDGNGELASTKGTAGATNLEGFSLEATSIGDWERKGGSVYLVLNISGKLTQDRTSITFDVTNLPLRSGTQVVLAAPNFFGTEQENGSYAGVGSFEITSGGGRKNGSSYTTRLTVVFPDGEHSASTKFKVVAYVMVHDIVKN